MSSGPVSTIPSADHHTVPRVRRIVAPESVSGPLRVLVVLALGTAVTALVVRCTCAAQARGWLGFGFGGTSATVGQAWQIFASNAELLGGVLVAVLVTRLRANDSSDGPGDAILQGIGWICDLALAGATAVNVALVGASFGAYGTRMVDVVLPHGPVEVGAYAVGLHLYLRARRGPIALRTCVCTAAVGFALLAVAAVLETYGQIG